MKAAVIQINSTADRDRNLEVAAAQVRAAASAGAGILVLPEKWPLLAAGEDLAVGAQPIDGPAISAACSWAAELGVHIVAGSFTEDLGEQRKPSNTSVLISPDGEILATYRKIHMFDVDVGGVCYRESDFEAAGDKLVTSPLGESILGMSICYDLRFPELYRALVDRGVELFSIPSAFTSVTGRDHWEVLLRARAIENQAFVLAANQTGTTAPEYDSWGHSMIVDPWGRILDQLDEREGFAIADLDFDERRRATASIPALEHRRPGLYGRGSAGD